jgi:hypothetical protein
VRHQLEWTQQGFGLLALSYDDRKRIATKFFIGGYSGAAATKAGWEAHATSIALMRLHPA